MNFNQYLEINKQGFEGDTFLKERIQKLIEQYGIKTIVETGTFKGSTTVQFANMVDTVYTTEVNPEYYAEATKKFLDKSIENIQHNLGSSVDILPKILPSIPQPQVVLFFLDAHWGPNNPLLEELQIIADHKLQPVIAIHDFKVPGHPELGYDTYGGQDYEWEWIKDKVEIIYGKDGYQVSYNAEAVGMKRGVIFITPKDK